MALFDPTDGGAAIQQNGTYNANPLSMVAGMVTLQTLTPEAYARLDTMTQRLASELDAVFEDAGVEAQVITAGSLFRIFFLPNPPRNYREAAQENKQMVKWLQFWLLNHDIMWSTSGNVSLPMTDVHIDTFVSTVAAGLTTITK